LSVSLPIKKKKKTHAENKAKIMSTNI